MTRQRLWVNYSVSFGASALLLLFGIIAATTAVPLPLWVAFAFGGLVSAYFGLLTSKQLVDSGEALDREHSRRQGADAELQQQRSAIDNFADGLDVAIFITDERGDVLYANRRAAAMFNFPEPIGRTVLAITLSYDLQNLLALCSKTKEKQVSEISFSFPIDRICNCEVWLEPTSERFFISVQDVTQLRRLERVRTDFVANVSHELRTPLASIRAMAETMNDDPDSVQDLSRRYLPRIIAEVDRLALLSSDLLSLTSAESNPVRKHTCDIAGVYQSAISELERKAHDKGLSLTYNGPPSLEIEANSAQMSQVAINLIDNAINYTNYGAVAVILSKGSSTVEIQVQDTGIGIGSEQVPRIFERFYRVDRARSRASGGTGLGLSIVRHIVEAHGGTIQVESSLNQGTTFTVSLPT